MTTPAQSNPKRIPSDRELAEYRSGLATSTKRCLLRVTTMLVPLDTTPLCRRELPGLPTEKR